MTDGWSYQTLGSSPRPLEDAVLEQHTSQVRARPLWRMPSEHTRLSSPASVVRWNLTQPELRLSASTCDGLCFSSKHSSDQAAP
jgi:hypothetical protein